MVCQIVGRKHKYPLVLSPGLKDGKICCLDGCCRKLNTHQCPVYRCVVGICKKYVEVLSQDSEQYVTVGERMV
jgi:hypothetical protein